jgi:hypothetical protein
MQSFMATGCRCRAAFNPCPFRNVWPAPRGVQIAAREKCSIRQVNLTISLAFLAPELVKAAVEGRLSCGIGVNRLRDAPAEWSRQYAMLGLSI